ncbi:MAG: carbohydrate ABC transporter permease [Treponema sp.]|jgi:putative aldouronate transport system permease protein|nr:carbohydrate ABC transporter permease [Treponema sp.]
MVKKKGVRDSVSERIFVGVIVGLLVFIDVVMLYPFIYVFSTAISDTGQVMAGNVWLYPRGIDFTAIKQIATYPLFTQSYLNTIIYTIFGTLTCVFITCLTAYPLAQMKFRLRGFISVVYVITMFFGGGMIPTFLMYRNLGLVDNRLVMILPGALSAWNIIICRTFFRSIPVSLSESAYLDGASDWKILWRVIMPLSQPIIATLALFAAVGIWNDFFTGLLFFNDSKKYPLQLVLRMILVNASMSAAIAEGSFLEFTQKSATLALKSASILISILPIICIYPFIQKYFVKGVMIGSIKE